MKLSEFYKNEKFSYMINGIKLPRDFLKTDNGELNVDEERNLFYKEDFSKSPKLLCSDVGEWIYFNDKKIVCSPYYINNAWDEIYVRIVDTNMDATLAGSLTQYGLVYIRNNEIIKENSKQEASVIFKLQNTKTPIMFLKDSFSVPFYYPYSNFLYEKFYDYDGNYLEEDTKQAFIQKFLRDLIYSFVNCPISPSGLTSQQKKTLDNLDAIRFGTTKVTYDVVDKIIALAEDGNISDKYAVRGYQKLKNLFISHDINDNLVKPLLNVMVVNRSGEFGRCSSKWVSLVNAKRIETIAKINRDSFKNIVSDISLLWENMSSIIK